MSPLFSQSLVPIAAYLLGSLSSAILICRVCGLPDPRDQGSGNPGATNVLRFGGKRLAALVLVGDLLKGLLAVLLAQWLIPFPTAIAASGFAAFLGHLYPVFFGFRGGKGVATALGVILGLSWLLGLVAVGIWLIMALVFRISSLAAVTAAVLTPLTAYAMELPPAYALVTTLMSVTLLWRHRKNIRGLIAGTEPRIGKN